MRDIEDVVVAKTRGKKGERLPDKFKEQFSKKNRGCIIIFIITAKQCENYEKSIIWYLDM